MQKIKDNLGLIVVSTATVLYLFLLLCSVFDLTEFSSLKLNEKGDVLAGIFAPLAFLWLVYGYYQQGQELKLQAQELSNLVEEQQKQNAIHENQLASKHFSVRPYLEFSSCSIEVIHRQDSIYDENGEAVDVGELYLELVINFKIENKSHNAYNVEVINNQNDYLNDQFFLISKDQRVASHIVLNEEVVSNLEKNEELNVTAYVNYSDTYGKPYTKTLHFHIYQFDWSLQYAMITMNVSHN